MVDTTPRADAQALRVEEVKQASKRPYWKSKRVMDFLISLLLIILCFPLFLIISVLIILDDPRGSPLYSQTRLGLHEKPFIMYKFRSMTVDAESLQRELMELNEMDGPVFKIQNDPRVTRIGRFLRRTSLDELPQFFNVLKGDMSLIGPRPPLPQEVAAYTDYDRLRLIVKPGLSCKWQIRNDRNQTAFSQWVEDDLEYILHASLWTDIKLFLKTPLAMLRGEGC